MKHIVKKAIKYAIDSDYRFLANASLGLYNHWDDEAYLKRKFRAILGRDLDLQDPRTFNEKLQWIKLHDRRPEYTVMVDKYLVREYISKKLGEQYLIPLLGVWDSPDEIDFDALPNQFVMKCNHNSGLGMYICKDKSQMDIEKVKRELRKGMAQDYYLTGREWPYKDVPRKAIAEQFITDQNGQLVDYKFFCFNGVVDSVMVCIERETGNPQFYFFDEQWNLKRYNIRGKEAPENFTLPMPENTDKMFDIARQLSRGIPFVRVDLYNVDGRIYFGEMTFFPDSGFDRNLLTQTDELWGSMLQLPKCKEA